jgi:hypothetical protein
VVGEPPVGALRLAAETAPAPDPREGYWLCARHGRHHARHRHGSYRCPASGLTTAAADAVVRILNAIFAADAMELFAPHPSRWYIRTGAPTAADDNRALAGNRPFDAASVAPRQRTAAWRTRLNETQMLLHSHRPSCG